MLIILLHIAKVEIRGHDYLDLVTEVKKGTVLLLACGQRDVLLHVDVREALLDGVVKDLQIQAHRLASQNMKQRNWL